MLKQWPHLYIARVCVEAQTPLSIQTGQADQNFDTSLVRDTNGLPALPPTSTRGVIRHLYLDQFGEEDTNTIFGFAKVQHNDPDDQTARLQISWGVIHDEHNRPVAPLQLIDENQRFLEELAQLQPIKRERVRINHLGTAEDQGKFDITACPKGVRFSFELKYWSDRANDPNWTNLLSLLSHPQFRLGHSTRSGFGALAIHRLHQKHFDLTQSDDAQAWQKLSRNLDNVQGFNNVLPETQSNEYQEFNLHLTAEGFVRIGGGDLPYNNSDDASDLIMQTESFIEWPENKGRFHKRVPIIPASTIKGPLAHRTLFHYNRLSEQFADVLNQEERKLAANRNHYEDLITLFGAAKGDELLKESSYKDGKVGQLIINDIYLTEHSSDHTMQLWHNRIDRFTGGVIDGALFTEEVLFEPSVKLTITLTKPDALSELARKSFEAALDDLCNGRLTIGAGGSRGLGSFRMSEGA